MASIGSVCSETFEGFGGGISGGGFGGKGDHQLRKLSWKVASGRNILFSALDLYAEGVGAKRIIAHRILWSSGGAKKETSKRSAFSALSFSQSVVDLRESCRFDSMVVGASVRTEMGLKKNVGQ